MRTIVVILALFLASFGSGVAQSQSQATAPKAAPQAATPKTTDTVALSIDPQKAAEIRTLLEAVGTRALMDQTLSSSLKSMKPLMIKSLPPGAYRERLVDLFVEKFQSNLDLDKFMDKAIPIYDRYFSTDEVKQLIVFYQTPLGKKTLTTLPTLMNEMRQTGEEWGREVGQSSMQQVLAEHPDLAMELEEAAKAGKAN